jgi:hypothetical protein
MSSPTTFGQRLNKPLTQVLLERNIIDEASLDNPQTIKELAYKAYIVAQEHVYEDETGIIVEAWMPETLAMDVNATYEAPFAQGLNQVNENLGAVARFLGVNLTTQALTAQIWQGGAFIEFSLPLIFQADSSAAYDVMEPIKKLFSLTMPKDPEGGGLLEAPGPRIDLNRLASNARENGGQVLNQLLSTTTSNISNPAQMLNSAREAFSNPTGFVQQALNTANEGAQAVSKAIVASVKNNISLYLGQFLYFPSVVITDVNPTYDVVLSRDKNPMRATVNINFRTFYVPTDRDISIMFPASSNLKTRARG